VGIAQEVARAGLSLSHQIDSHRKRPCGVDVRVAEDPIVNRTGF
jgi:hypothetical protein